MAQSRAARVFFFRQLFSRQRGEGYFVVNVGSNPIFRIAVETPLPDSSSISFHFDWAMRQLAWNSIFAAVREELLRHHCTVEADKPQRSTIRRAGSQDLAQLGASPRQMRRLAPYWRRCAAESVVLCGRPALPSFLRDPLPRRPRSGLLWQADGKRIIGAHARSL